MLRIAGSASFVLKLPVDMATAFRYYSDMTAVARHLKHIELLHTDAAAATRHRLAFETMELGTYTIQIVCDVEMTADTATHTICLTPINNLPPIQPSASLNATLGRGYYSATARFKQEQAHTRIDYNLSLEAALPPPTSMRFMPKRISNKIVSGITTIRLKEIADHFMRDSAQVFQATAV